MMSAAEPLGEEPRTYKEAIASPQKDKWIQAMASEMNDVDFSATT